MLREDGSRNVVEKNEGGSSRASDEEREETV